MEPAGNVLPIYFVADESYSMATVMHTLNEGLLSLLDALQSETMAASKVRLCVIGFSGDAVTYLEPADLRDLEDMPTLQARGSTSYAAAFSLLQSRIPQDIAALKAQNYLVNRPTVFFLTDGAPDAHEDWKVPYDQLTDPAAPHPNILAFGVGDAVPDVIQQVATRSEYAFVTAEGVDTGRAIAEFIKALTQSVISSGQAVAAGNATLPIEKPEGFISLAVDVV